MKQKKKIRNLKLVITLVDTESILEILEAL